MQSTGMFLDDFPVLRYQWKFFLKLFKYEKKFAIMFCFQGLIVDILLSKDNFGNFLLIASGPEIVVQRADYNISVRI